MQKKREAYPKLIYEDIGLMYDDQTVSFDTLEELLDFLIELKFIGYHVPEDTFMMITEELEEDK